MVKDRNQYKNVLENALGIPFTQKNSVETLVNGDEIFPAMLDAIEKAERQIDFLTFVYWSGEIAVKFAKALSKKADEGVKVRVILDSYGANFMPDELSKLMENHGVELKWFRPLVRWKIWKTDDMCASSCNYITLTANGIRFNLLVYKLKNKDYSQA